MPRTTNRLRRRRLGSLSAPRVATDRRAPEPHQLDDGFVFWPESLGPRPSDGPALVRVGTASRVLRRPSRPRGRRALGSLAFAALFFGGAAFTASAGDKMAGLLGATQPHDPAGALAQMQSDPAAAPRALAPVQAPSSAPKRALARISVAHARPAVVTAALAHVAVRTPAAPVHTLVKRVTASRVAPARPAVRTVPKRTPRHAQRVRAAEPVHDLLLSAAVGTAPFAVAPRGAAFWESVALPDPIPAALRLDPAFAKRLNETSARAGVDWALVLGVARAAGGRSASPVAPAALAALGAKLASLGAGADEWAAARAYGHADTFADTAVALAHYNRAVGLDALVHGLAAQKLALETRVLADPRVTIYAGGRDDVVQGHVDVRVLAVIEYMAETYGQVSISSLISGHREFARPGVVSAHVYGRALDIASVDGVAIYGHQQRGSITERAVKALLLLPAEVEPAQIISLIGLGGPSFSLADHYDHIHVGF